MELLNESRMRSVAILLRGRDKGGFEMLCFVIELEPIDGYELPRYCLLIFAYSKSEAMFNAGAQAALHGCTERIGLTRSALEEGGNFYIAADGLETTCWDMHQSHFWEMFECEASNWGKQLSGFANSFPGAAWNLRKIGAAMGFDELFQSEPALAAFNAAVEVFEIEQELGDGSRNSS